MLLAIETATRTMSVALLDGERLVGELVNRDDRAHAERLLPAVDQLLRRAALSLDEVEAFAVSLGPGSFTGLRIGLATVKGLAFGSDRLVAPVPTLAALSLAAPDDAPVAALLDARRGEVYAAVYGRAGGALELLRSDRVYTPEELAPALPAGCMLVPGEGAEAAAAAIQALRGSAVRAVPAALGCARAYHVALVGRQMLARGEGLSAPDLVPRYVRRAEPEVRRTGLRFEGDAA